VITRVKSSRRASAVVVALVILLLAVAAWFGVVAPKRSHATQLKSDVAAAETQLATATQAAAVANRAAAAAAERAMPSTPDEPEILDQLNQLGKKTGVLVATVSPSTSTTTTSTSIVPLSVVVDGSYFQISNFLNKLRTQVQVSKSGKIVANGRLYDVQSVNITNASVGGKLSATVQVNASTYTPSVPAPSTTAPATAAAAAPAGSAG
jgi:Tfp pilus assembly protein PilO